MKVAMVGPFGLRPKGTMRARALPMAKALAARGHRVDVFLPPWSCPEESGREWQEDGVGIHNIVLPLRIPLLRHLLVTWRLVAKALRGRPDVIHCFKPKAYAGLVAMAIWLMRRLGLVKVCLVIDSDDWEGRGGWNEVENYTWAQRRFFEFQERWGLTHNDALTVASRALETLAWSLGVAPERVFYVPNGAEVQGGRGAEVISPPHPSTSAPPLRKGGGGAGGRATCPSLTVLLYTRFFEFQVERAVEIFRRVLAAAPQTLFLVIGKGFFGEERRLLHLIEEAGIADRVDYVGWVEPEELHLYFAAADVAIYPYDDTLINRTKCAVKLIELMAVSIPVVADDVGQNGEYIEHLVSGLLVEPGDTEAFAASVIRLLRDEGLREALGREAQRRIYEQFGWDRVVEAVERAYQVAEGAGHG